MSALHQSSNGQVLIIYHTGCLDGFVSAFTIWSDLKNSAEYFPAQFGKSPPDVTGKIVYILDFSYPSDILNDMIGKARALLVIDHHKTAIEHLNEIHPKHKIFDIKECGATLTWNYLYPDKPLPLLYKYIRSRDNWTHDMPDTDAFAAAFDLAIRGSDHHYNFELVKPFLEPNEVSNLIPIGKVLVSFQNALIDKSLNHAYFCPVWIPDRINNSKKLVIVAYINAVQLISEIGDRCLTDFPFVDFCVCFYVDPQTSETQFSLRSRDDREDVRVIAEDFGGGGHRNAAGFRTSTLECKLNYKHLDSIPLNCVYRDKQFRLDTRSGSVLTQDYVKLLQRKFPGKSLKIVLSLDAYPMFK